LKREDEREGHLFKTTFDQAGYFEDPLSFRRLSSEEGRLLFRRIGGTGVSAAIRVFRNTACGPEVEG